MHKRDRAENIITRINKESLFISEFSTLHTPVVKFNVLRNRYRGVIVPKAYHPDVIEPGLFMYT